MVRRHEPEFATAAMSAARTVLLGKMSLTEASQIYSVSTNTIKRAIRVNRTGIDELVDYVAAGNASVAFGDLVCRLPVDQQAEALDRHMRGENPKEVVQRYHVPHLGTGNQWTKRRGFLSEAAISHATSNWAAVLDAVQGRDLDPQITPEQAGEFLRDMTRHAGGYQRLRRLLTERAEST